MLHSFNIEFVADIRTLPGSRKFPHFNKENLEVSLAAADIQYAHLAGLGGRRKAKQNSKNTRWNNPSFRGYADYMETGAFKDAIAELERIALVQSTAYMCSEALWWRCHRSMLSDYLMAKGWAVLHILAKEKTQEHKYTSPARLVNGSVMYSEEN
jgi:uncharacterized protein (DUF488 family)